MSDDLYPDLSQVRRVLVTKLRHHGDVLLASPVISTLKRHLPDAEIDALIYRETRDMLSSHPALAQLQLVDKGGRFLDELRLLKSLRERRYDLIVHLTTSRRGTWLAKLLNPQISVAPSRSDRFYRNSFTHLYRHANARHIVECNLDALRRIGIFPQEADKKVLLVPGHDAEAEIENRLQRYGLQTQQFVLVHPTSRWSFKCWPEEKVALFADRMEAHGHPVLFSSGPDRQETGMVESILSRMRKPALSMAGQLSLKELAALLARARVFVGMDSAPMHMAAAMGTPVVALFGPSGCNIWGPWNVPSRVVTSEHSCRPCGFDGCGGSKRSDCMEVISVDQVFEAARELWKGSH